MPVELLGPALFILMSVAFFWASKTGGSRCGYNASVWATRFIKAGSDAFQGIELDVDIVRHLDTGYRGWHFGVDLWWMANILQRS